LLYFYFYSLQENQMLRSQQSAAWPQCAPPSLVPELAASAASEKENAVPVAPPRRHHRSRPSSSSGGASGSAGAARSGSSLDPRFARFLDFVRGKHPGAVNGPQREFMQLVTSEWKALSSEQRAEFKGPQA
jgi:hypothetical protein